MLLKEVEKEHINLMKSINSSDRDNTGELALVKVVQAFKLRLRKAGQSMHDVWQRQCVRGMLIFWGSYLASMGAGFGEIRLGTLRAPDQGIDIPNLRRKRSAQDEDIIIPLFYMHEAAEFGEIRLSMLRAPDQGMDTSNPKRKRPAQDEDSIIPLFYMHEPREVA